MVTSTGSAPGVVETAVPSCVTVTSPAGTTVDGRSSVTLMVRALVVPVFVTVMT